MSGIKPIELTEFYRSLHGRGLTTDVLGMALGVSGGTGRRLLGNLRKRRGPVWRAILAQLTPKEKRLLASVEQSSTWNRRQEAKRPVWTKENAIGVAAAKARREMAEVGE